MSEELKLTPKQEQEKEFALKVIAKFGWLPINNNTSREILVGEIFEYPDCFPTRAVIIGKATPEEVQAVITFFKEEGIPIYSNTNNTYKVMVD